MTRKKFASGSGQNAASILVKYKLGLEENVVNSLKKVEGVGEVKQVYGTPYIIIVKVVCDTPDKLSAAV